jgi:toxin ParE1/3/4
MRVSWTRPAFADLDDIQDYVAQDSPRAAFTLVTELIDRTERLLSRKSSYRSRGSRGWNA